MNILQRLKNLFRRSQPKVSTKIDKFYNQYGYELSGDTLAQSTTYGIRKDGALVAVGKVYKGVFKVYFNISPIYIANIKGQDRFTKDEEFKHLATALRRVMAHINTEKANEQRRKKSED